MKELLREYQTVRKKTEAICLPLLTEDYVIQSMDDVSPPKWHLAHTTWFFETFILSRQILNYQPFHPSFQYLFNSYYQTIGHPYPRKHRGLLSRPSVKTIYEYRKYVDEQMLKFIDLLESGSENHTEMVFLITLGLHHEQQHQELLLTDIKFNFSQDPLFPAYQIETPPIHYYHPYQSYEFTFVEGGVINIGHEGLGFCFDNELPRHQHILNPYLMGTRLVTNAEYCEFINSGGYQTPDWWLADGMDCVLNNHWQAPLYWHQQDGKWHVFTLNGLKELDMNEPVSHVSYYEADAYARWRGFRLPSEAEWEHFIHIHNIKGDKGNFLENNHFHPQATQENDLSLPQQLFGDVWEWTKTSYSPYPGFKPLTGSLSEYNGKFMSNQMVLRGGSCVTPQNHIRATYRNFFEPSKRWQFSGIRLAADV